MLLPLDLVPTGWILGACLSTGAPVFSGKVIAEKSAMLRLNPCREYMRCNPCVVHLFGFSPDQPTPRSEVSPVAPSINVTKTTMSPYQTPQPAYRRMASEYIFWRCRSQHSCVASKSLSLFFASQALMAPLFSYSARL